jgi:hypothetical protein
MITTSGFRAREEHRRAQYRLADERCEELGLGRICVLCRLGVPTPPEMGGIADDYHEIEPKSALPGAENLKRLYRLPNIAPTCRYHHDAFQPEPKVLWQIAMVAARLAKWSDYPDVPEWARGKNPFAYETCKGEWGFGTKWLRAHFGHDVPGRLTMIYAHTGNKIDHWCLGCCPAYGGCVARWRERNTNQSESNADQDF